ncbi:SRPBCC family protein [soil metagenome]
MNLANTLSVTTPSDREARLSRTFAAPAELVFRAYTEPALVSQWMLGPEGWTMPICDIDLRPGGTWHFVWRKSSGQEMSMHGTYLELDPPSRLVSTENWGADWPETTNTTVLQEKDGKTVVSITILYPSKEARDAAMQTGMKDGAAVSYDRLEKLLVSIS